MENLLSNSSRCYFFNLDLNLKSNKFNADCFIQNMSLNLTKIHKGRKEKFQNEQRGNTFKKVKNHCTRLEPLFKNQVKTKN